MRIKLYHSRRLSNFAYTEFYGAPALDVAGIDTAIIYTAFFGRGYDYTPRFCALYDNTKWSARNGLTILL